MGSLGGSGSSSNNLSLSNGKFGQNVWGPQGNALTNLYNNANSLFDSTVGNMQGQLPGVIANQGNVANTALGGANNLLNGGAFSGITGQGIMDKVSSLAANPSAMANTFSGVSPLGGGMSTNIMNLPGQIGTHQVDTLDMLRPMDSRQTQNNLLPSGLLNPMTGVGNMNNTSKVYSDIMGGSGNSYADAMKGTVMNDAKRMGDQALNSIDQRAAAGGMGGSTRQGIAQANALQDINRNAQNDLTKIGYDTFNTDLGNKLNIAQQADTNATNRYLGNLNYNTGLVNAGNTAALNSQNYNLGTGGLANTANANNLNYNIGYGQNTNANNANAYGYGNNLYNAGMGFNTAVTNANAGLANGAMGLNGAIANILPGFANGAQSSIQSGLAAMPGVSGLYGAGLNSTMSPFNALTGYADAIGGPVVLGNGKYSSMGQGSSKGGGGGLSIAGG